MEPRIIVAGACIALLAISPSLHAQSRVSELNDAGWKALRDGNGRRAKALFDEALTLRPHDPVLLLGAGAAARAEGRPREAMAHLKESLQRNPALTPASVLLGEIAFEEGDVDLAIRTYEEALKHAPRDPVLVGRLDGWRREVALHGRFEEARYDRFRVMFEGRADQSLAIHAAGILNAAFWRIGQTLGTYPSQTIVTVLYTEKQFRDVTRAPEWSAGQYDGRIRIPAAGAALKPELFQQVLVHELTHAMISAIAPAGVPAWLHEGLAQSFDGSDPEAARRRMKAARGTIPLVRLERGFHGLTAADALVAYDESLLAVTVMLARPGFGWPQLLGTLAGGQPFVRAIAGFGFSYGDLEAPFAR